MTRKRKLKKHIINRESCTDCGICVAVCPKDVLELDKKEKAAAARKEDCLACPCVNRSVGTWPSRRNQK